jgi:predicted transglutaminase-like cysteine proteinase
MRCRRLCSSAIIALFVSVMPALAAWPPAIADLRAAPMPPSFIAPMPSLFDTQEIFHGDTSPFKQWIDMLGRANAEFATTSSSCIGRQPECELNKWSQLVAQIAPLQLRDKVSRVNAVLNRVPYVPTTRNWSRASYWEAPLEFLAYGGQCQDYAVAKYMALRQAGVPADEMRIVVLRATALGEDHAVLVVDVDGEALMLDDGRIDVIPARSETSYRPYYSINELGWWQHVAADTSEIAERQARPPNPHATADLFAAPVAFTVESWRGAARMIDSILIPFAEP